MISESSATTCPYCQAALVTAGIAHADWVRCALCRASFVLGAGREMERTSRKAIASLILGLSSLVFTFFSAIPAIVLGVVALRDIRRRRGMLLGRGLALAGIVSGALLGLGGGMVLVVVVTGGFWIQRSFVRTDQADRIQAMAATIADFDLPDGVQPRYATRFPGGMRMLEYRRDEEDPGSLEIILIYYPGWMVVDRSHARNPLAYHQDELPGSLVESSRAWTCQVGGELAEVGEQVRSSPDGKVYTNYMTALSAREGFVIVIVSVRQPQQDDAQWPLTEEQVRQFLASFAAEPRE